MLSLMALMIVIIMFNLSLHMYINFKKLINENLFMIYDEETGELIPNNPCEEDFE